MLGFGPLSSGPIGSTGVAGSFGLVVDGYLSGATVARVNGSHNATVTTDSNGVFSGLTGDGSIKATGGVDMSTGSAFLGQFSAPEADYAVISPLTTMIDALVSAGAAPDVATASGYIRSAMSLPNVDLLTMNPITGDYVGGTASSADTLAVFKANLYISQLLAISSGGN